jgi:hypothetical protein
MSFDANGVFHGHTSEDDEYGKELRVGAVVCHAVLHSMWGLVVYADPGTDCWDVHWDGDESPTPGYYSKDLKVSK